jgi:hypothetical protein
MTALKGSRVPVIGGRPGIRRLGDGPDPRSRRRTWLADVIMRRRGWNMVVYFKPT